MNKTLFNKDSYYLPGVSGMLALFVMFLLGAVLGNIVVLVLTAFLHAALATELSTVISYPLMFVPPMIFARRRSRMASIFNSGLAVDSNNFGRLGGVRMAFAAAFATIAMAFVAEPVTALLPAAPEWFEQIMESMTGGNIILSFICVSIFAPLFEEWLCRGMVLRGLLTKMSPAWAIAVSALFFAVLHMNPWQAVPAFILGAFFGYVYYRTGSLKLTMLMHCVNNTFAVIFSKIPQFADAECFLDVMRPWVYVCIFIACAAFTWGAIITLGNIPFKKDDAGCNCDEIEAMTF